MGAAPSPCMLWLLALLLFLVWLFGLVGGYSAGVWIHAFLVLAVLVLALAIVGRHRRIQRPLG